MKRRCVIVANMVPAHFGWGVRAPGLRAAQLAHHARRHFDEVVFLLFLERYNLLRHERGAFVLASARADTTIIPAAAFPAYAARTAPATFVFTQAEFAREAEIAAPRHRVVYDILAPREKELTLAGAALDTIEAHRRNHARMLTLADRILVNGPRSMRLFAGDIGTRPARTCCLAPPPAPPSNWPRRLLVFGGKPQRWTDSAPLFEAMADLLTRRTDIAAAMISPPVADDEPHAEAHRRLLAAPNVTPLWNLSALSYAELLARTAAFIDWTPLNDERVHATSVRTLQAIAAGIPVLHQAGTALDEFFDAFPGTRLDGPLTPAAIEDFTAEAAAGAHAAPVAAAIERLHAYRAAPVFQGLAAPEDRATPTQAPPQPPPPAYWRGPGEWREPQGGPG
ncbi:hypothetical protein [Acuticoccus kandeliae]|uniref:hypothetical protein n=1 Tax=Acuticoccus kandeliae TaxID=2073160 RepID=UPI000D3EDC25|nr:hypothetical protein [Acuticoccus kandeliae]